MIRATCKTNLDGFELTKWPTRFLALPRVGDWVQGYGQEGRHPKLRVHTITHYMETTGLRNAPTLQPAIKIELHK